MGSLLRVSWTQSAPLETWLEYRVDEDWLSSPPTHREAGEAEELVLGAPFDTPVDVRLVWAEGAEELGSTTTGSLPEDAPVATEVSGDADAWDPEMAWVLLSTGSGARMDSTWTVIIDRAGRVVWAKPSESRRVNLHPQLSLDGSQILIDQNSFWAVFDGGVEAVVERVDLTGQVLETIPTPRAHHPFAELPDGSIIWGALSPDFSDEKLKRWVSEDEQEVLWSCADFLAAEAPDVESSCGSNTLSYDPERDTLLYSSYVLETVVEVDASSGETLRTFGHVGDNAFAFEPLESAFWWQHGPHYTERGTLLVSSKDVDEGTETVVREYTVDDATQTLVEVQSFGLGEGIYGDTMGEADLTPSGHVLHNYGSDPRLREFDPDGKVVWEVSWTGSFVGRSTPLSDLYELAY